MEQVEETFLYPSVVHTEEQEKWENCSGSFPEGKMQPGLRIPRNQTIPHLCIHVSQLFTDEEEESYFLDYRDMLGNLTIR